MHSFNWNLIIVLLFLVDFVGVFMIAATALSLRDIKRFSLHKQYKLFIALNIASVCLMPLLSFNNPKSTILPILAILFTIMIGLALIIMVDINDKDIMKMDLAIIIWAILLDIATHVIFVMVIGYEILSKGIVLW